MKQFTAGSNEDGVRLSRFVQSVTTQLPNALLYKGFRNKRIKVNGKKGDPDTRLCVGDIIELYLNDEFFEARPAVAAPNPSRPNPAKPKGSLRIVYEDENILALYKPAHLLCHSDRTGDVSLVDMLLDYLVRTKQYQPDTEHTFTPALCNRLDRGTEGLVLAAKNYAALRDLNTIIRTDLLQKEYLCITAGIPPKGRHIAYLQHRERDNKVTVQTEPGYGYKQIITDVAVEKTSGPFALCRIGLITGRTHQIRAHLAFLNAPVLGDIKYGNRKMNERARFKTQALCAVSITFRTIPKDNVLHELSGKQIALEEPNIVKQYYALTQPL